MAAAAAAAVAADDGDTRENIWDGPELPGAPVRRDGGSCGGSQPTMRKGHAVTFLCPLSHRSRSGSLSCCRRRRRQRQPAVALANVQSPFAFSASSLLERAEARTRSIGKDRIAHCCRVARSRAPGADQATVCILRCAVQLLGRRARLLHETPAGPAGHIYETVLKIIIKRPNDPAAAASSTCRLARPPRRTRRQQRSAAPRRKSH